uniref:Reverse transcriptase domain-containing protein n=1 Tax=Latimeria chalumnae TaxID=7897 RepID=H3B4N3_LATCH
KIATGNVRTLYRTGKTAQACKEMDAYHLDILRISECRWEGAGKIKLAAGRTIYFSGRQDGQHKEGVTVIVIKDTDKTVIEWDPVNERIIKICFNSHYAKLTIIQCYAPTNDHDRESKDNFYNALEDTIRKVPKHDVMVLIGDLNTKIRNDNTGRESIMGRQVLGVMNDNGERFINFCAENKLVIGGSIFQHKDNHKSNWTSPGGKTENQIDYIAINSKWRNSLMDIRGKRGADIGSNHTLVTAKIKLKLWKTKLKKHGTLFNCERLQRQDVRETFQSVLCNRLSLLADAPETHSVEEEWTRIKETFQIIGEKIGPKKRKQEAETWKCIKERKELKQTFLTVQHHEVEQKRQEYKEKDKEVKWRAKQDKRKYLEQKAEEAEKAAKLGDMGTLYKLTKFLSGMKKPTGTSVLKGKDGQILTKEKDKIKRWKEHFEEVLNRTPLEHPALLPRGNWQFEMEMGPTKEREIVQAIKKIKNGKASDENKITVEMIKAGMDTSVTILTNLFNKVWKEEKIPEDWKHGIIVKLPKKGDLSDCNNWWDITLLSTPGKIFSRILLERMKISAEKTIREEQAGFRENRSCMDNIVIRNIAKQCLEWNTTAYFNFIDFEKAFDSLHRESLWKILDLYGIPTKVVNILKGFYNGYSCIVRQDAVTSGVRQGCILSPFLFLLALDWVMIRTTTEKRGLQWGLPNTLEDIDFADDICLLSQKRELMQEKTDTLSESAQQIGLKVNIKKTKVMKLNVEREGPITCSGEDLEELQQFNYLGSILAADGDIEIEIQRRIGLVTNAFNTLLNIWKSKKIKTKTKLKLYKSNIRLVLLHAAGSWRTNKKLESRLHGFKSRCLRRILNIKYLMLKSETSPTQIDDVKTEIQRRRWCWIGHLLRMSNKRHLKHALTWTPQGKRNRGRPKGTWRNTVETERQRFDKTWSEFKWLAQDRRK